jgi:hypothetical protein
LASFYYQQVIVGYDNSTSSKTPFYFPRNIITKHGCILQAIKSNYICDNTNIYFIMDSLEILEYVLTFELKNYFPINIVDKYHNIIRKSSSSSETIDFNDKSLKSIKKYCDKLNIKIVFNNSEFYNGICISTLIDKIID